MTGENPLPDEGSTLETWSKLVISIFGPKSPACEYLDYWIVKLGGQAKIDHMPSREFWACIVSIQMAADPDTLYRRQGIPASKTEH